MPHHKLKWEMSGYCLLECEMMRFSVIAGYSVYSAMTPEV